VSVVDVYRSLWRHKLLLVLLTACLGASAWYVSSTRPPVYEATALVRIQQSIDNPAEAFGALQTAGRLARTYAHIATTLAVAENVEEALGGRVPIEDIAGSIEAEQVEDIDLLAISVTNRDPARALAVADQAPAALQRFVEETGTTDDRIVTVQRPSLPEQPVSPRPLLALSLALVLGAILNGALLVAFDLRSDRALTPAELERLTRRPVIATVPNLALVTRDELALVQTPNGQLDDLDLRRAARG
jgi:receptor protein-tyrosine kinase